MYRFLNSVLDRVFPNRKDRDEYLIRTYLDHPWSGGGPSLINGSMGVVGVYLHLYPRRGFHGGRMSIWRFATTFRVSVEEVQAAIAYLRRNPEYLRKQIEGRQDVTIRSRWRLLAAA